MFEHISAIISDQFHTNGIDLVGSLMLALVFNLFYSHNTQYSRFRLISWAFWVRVLLLVLVFILPVLPELNPAFQVSFDHRIMIVLILTSTSSGYLLSSLFPQLPDSMKFIGIPFFFTVFLNILCYFISPFLQQSFLAYGLPSVVWGISLLFVAISFFFIQTASRTNLFSSAGKCLAALAIYQLLYAFDAIPTAWWAIPVLLYSATIILVLIGQTQFIETTCLSLQKQLAVERGKRSSVWDIAPFPIVITKLLDDQILYMNQQAKNILGISENDLSKIHFANYFVDPNKRDELIALANKQTVVESFQIQAKSAFTGAILWINLSARVLELDGELTLYINFIDITKAKETEQELFLQASTDTLTGLYNRRQFEAMSKQAFALHERTGNPFSVMMLDIDHFKSINDTYGHDAGDIVLKNLAKIMQDTMRKSDIIARFGGEEFIIFLMNTPPQDGLVAANKLREAVENAVIMAGSTKIPITISLGVSASQQQDLSLLAKEADLALYYSKEHGRNQAALYVHQMTEDPDTIAKHTP